MKLDSLQKLLIHELKDLYSAEKQLVKALPKMAKAATNPELKKAFSGHLEETKGHVDRLEAVFDKLEGKPSGQKCVGMEGLIEEGSHLIDADAEESVRDAGLITAAQRVEHYEIAGYGSAVQFAMHLGMRDVAKVLQTILDEEGEADKKLTKIASDSVNQKAMAGV